MAIYRWNSLRQAAALQNRVNSLFQEMATPENTETAQASFAPAVDIYEDDQKIVLKLDVPGIREQDLNIRVENNTLSIRGERKLEEEEENFHRIERSYGSFFRSFTLPTTVDTEKIEANYDAGVLVLTLLKKAEAKPKEIKVSLGAPKAVEATAGNSDAAKNAA